MKKSFIILLLIPLFFSCEEDEYVEIQMSTHVMAAFNGLILDEDGEPMEGVTISIEQESTLTGPTGTFILHHLEVLRSNAHITAFKEGYFRGSRTIQPIPDGQNTIHIVLMAMDEFNGFEATSGGNINLDNGGRVSVPANGIVNADGTPYDGWVIIYAKHLDPRDPDIGMQMPGNLIGLNTGGEERFLETYGMLALELQGEAGELLQIKEGMEAEIRVPLAGALSNEAPTEIPLWFYNDTTGLWQEEGFASREGEYYVCSVSHFSFWNCDAPFPLTRLSGSVSIEGVPASGLRISINRLSAEIKIGGNGYTNDEGLFAGMVPANELLELSVMNQCHEISHTVVVGPFDSNYKLDHIDITNTIASTVVSGVALNCAGEKIQDGFLSMRNDLHPSYFLIKDGDFEIPLLWCDGWDHVELRVVDLTTSTETDWLRFDLIENGLNLGEILTCEDYGQYILYHSTDLNLILRGNKAAGFGVTQYLPQLGPISYAHAINFDPGVEVSRMTLVFQELIIWFQREPTTMHLHSCSSHERACVMN